MRIVVIGTGNTASVLGRLLVEAGHSIQQVYGRTKEHAKHLAEILNSSFTVDRNQVDRTADLYLIAVSDSAINEIASWLRVDRKLVVHTAGSVGQDVLASCSTNYGVLYPLQSLRKEAIVLPEIPFLVEGNTNETATYIFDLAKTISPNVQISDSQHRLMTHIAAVMVGNFSNYLYVMAKDFCDLESIDFSMLLPLMKQTVDRLRQFSPMEMQTGPAVRNDLHTIERHLQLLEPYPEQKSFYRFFTDSIRNANK